MSVHAVHRIPSGSRRIPFWLVILITGLWSASAYGQITLSFPPERALSVDGLRLFTGTPDNVTASEDIPVDPPGLYLIWNSNGTQTWNGQAGWIYRAFGTVSLSALEGWKVTDLGSSQWAPLTAATSLHGLTWQPISATSPSKEMRRFFIPPPRATHELAVIQPLAEGGATVVPLTVANLNLHIQSDAQGNPGTDQTHGTAVALIDRSRPFWIADFSEDPPRRSADGVFDLVKTNWTTTQLPLVRVNFYLDPTVIGQRFTIHSQRQGSAEQMHSIVALGNNDPVEKLLWNGTPLSIAPNSCAILSALVHHESEVWMTRDVDTYPPGTGILRVDVTAAASTECLNWTAFGLIPVAPTESLSVEVNQTYGGQELFAHQAGGVFRLTRSAGTQSIADYAWDGSDNTMHYYTYTGTILSRGGVLGNQDFWVKDANGQLLNGPNVTTFYNDWYMQYGPGPGPVFSDRYFDVKLPASRSGDSWSLVDDQGNGIPASLHITTETADSYLWMDNWHRAEFEVAGITLKLHVENIYQMDLGMSMYLQNSATGEFGAIYEGSANDFRSWFQPAVESGFQISLTRWNHDLRVRSSNGAEFLVTNTVTHEVEQYFDALSYTRGDLKWWVWDATTNEEAPENTTDLRSWIAVKPAWNVTAVLQGGGSVSVGWTGPGGATSFEVIRSAGGSWLPIATVDGATAEAGYTYVDPFPAPGSINRYYIITHFGTRHSAKSNEAQVDVPPIVGPLAGIPLYEQDGNDGLFNANGTFFNPPWIPPAKLGVTRNPGGGNAFSVLQFASGSRVPPAPIIELYPDVVVVYENEDTEITEEFPDSVQIEWEAMGVYSGVKIERRLRNGEWVVVRTSATPGEMIVDNSLEPGEVYYYRARAYNGAGLSQPSNIVRWIPPVFIWHKHVIAKASVDRGSPPSVEVITGPPGFPDINSSNDRRVTQEANPSPGSAIGELPGFPQESRADSPGLTLGGDAGNSFTPNEYDGERDDSDEAHASRSYIWSDTRDRQASGARSSARFSYIIRSSRIEDDIEYRSFRPVQQRTLTKIGNTVIDLMPETGRHLRTFPAPSLRGVDSFSAGCDYGGGYGERHDYQRSVDWDEELFFQKNGSPEQVKIRIVRAFDFSLQYSWANLEVVGSNRFQVYGHKWVPDVVAGYGYNLEAYPVYTGNDCAEYEYLTVVPKFTGPDAANLNDSVTIKVRFSPKYISPFLHESLEGEGTQISDEIKVTYKGSDNPPVYEFSSQEASGPSYRKVALTGRPIGDDAPGDKAENDLPILGTFVDALTLQLNHRVEDISIPIPGSPLSLTVDRRIEAEVWNTTKGLAPDQEVYRPFGPGWSSSLGMHLKIVSKSGREAFAYVTDHAGGTHRFVWSSISNPGGSAPGGGGTIGNGVWIPLPSGKHEGVSDGFSLHENVFNSKSGVEIVFQPIQQLTNVITGPTTGGSAEYHSYLRPVRVTDALGNQLEYDYVDETRTMPMRIRWDGRDDLSLSIAYDSYNHIKKVWDPKGNVTEYVYETWLGFNTPVLKKVISNGQQFLAYEYNVQYEYDRRPRGSGETVAWFGHCNVSAILDGKNQRYAFAYDWDSSRSAYHAEQGAYTQSGLPRILKTVTFPGGAFSRFERLSTQAILPDSTSGALQLVGGCKTKVVDLEGAEIWYEFLQSEVHAVDMTWWMQDSIDPGGGPDQAVLSRRVSPTLVVLHRAMDLTYVGFGKFRFEFKPEAGMALSSVTDFTNRTTSYAYTETSRAPGAYNPLAAICPSLSNWASFHSEPTWVQNPAGKRQYFGYNMYRERVGSIDETGRVTSANHWESPLPTEKRSWKLNATELTDLPGQVASNGVKAVLSWPAGSPAQESQTIYTYDENFPGVVTLEQVVKRENDPASAWALSLRTYRELDEFGRVERQTVGIGAESVVTEMTHDLNGNLTSLKDGRKSVTTYLYDSRNRMVRTYLPTSEGQQLQFKEFQYDAAGNKTGERDERGHWTIFGYDTRNRLISVSRVISGVGTEVTRYEYNKVNSRTKVIDPRGAVALSAYDGLQRLISVTDAFGQPEARTVAYAYPQFAGGLDTLAGAEAGNGFQATKATDARGFITRTNYDILHRAKRTLIAYNTPGQNPAVGGTGVAVTETEYDDAGRVTKVIDPLNKETSTSYDALGRAEIVTYADSTAQNPKFTQAFYTSTGLKWKVRDEAGRFSETHYDSAGRVVRELGPVLADGNRPETTLDYDPSGNVKNRRVRRTGGVNGVFSQWIYNYDRRNRKIEELGPAVETGRPVQKWAYDAVGNAIAVQDARGKTTNMTYDERNRVRFVTSPQVKNVEGSLVRPVTETRYDLNGNILRVIDSEGRHAVNTYDRLNRLETTTDHVPITVTYGYDAADNRTSVKDGKNQVTTFAYDGLKRLKSETPPAGAATTYTYNAVNLTSKVDPVTATSFPLYDARHRLKQSVSDSYFTRSYDYDEAGRLKSVVDSGYNVPSTTSYVYDEASRLINETNSAVSHTYQYDLAGNRVLTLQGENGGGARRAIECEYDAAGRLKTMLERKASDPVGVGRITSYFYDGNGNIVRKELPNNVHERTSYDALNRRRLQATTQGPNYLLTSEQFYDRSGNVRVIEERVASDPTKDRRLLLEYDGACRLWWEKTKRWDGTISPGQWVDNGATEYLYDTANNRTWKRAYPAGEFTTPNATWESTYNSLNQLQTYVHRVGGVTQSTAIYAYDAAGRRIQRTRGPEQVTYAYNAYHQLGFIQRYNGGYPEQRRAFGYDYRARRIFQQSGNGTSGNGTIKRIVFSGGTSVREYDTSSTTSYYQSSGDLYFSGALPGTGTTSAEYVRGSDWGGGVGGLLYSLRLELGVDKPRYTHYDGRGDVVLQTDSTGEKTFEAAYEAFGTRTRESGSTPDRQRANTKEEETTFQLLNEGHRYRDLETGVWLTRDPAGFVDGPNLYAYVRQNPWSMFDPDGLKGKKERTPEEERGREFGNRLQKLHKALADGRISEAAFDRLNHDLHEQYLNNDSLPGGLDRELTELNDARLKQAQALQSAGTGVTDSADAVLAVAPIPQSNAEAGAMVAGPAAKGLLKGAQKAYAWAKRVVGEVKELRRPYIRKGVRSEVEARAPKTADGKFIDPNTGEVIEGKGDLGHKPGHEHRTEKAKGEAAGESQKEFNERMNNPDLYQIESPSSNRSHRHEKK